MKLRPLAVVLLLALTFILPRRATARVPMDAAGQAVQRLLADPTTRAVVVDFYGTWCKPCQSAIKRWAQMQGEYGSRGLRLVVVSVESEGRVLPEAHSGAAWVPEEVVRDDDRSLMARWGVKRLPAAYLFTWKGGLRPAAVVTGEAAGETVASRTEAFYRESLKILVEAPIDGRGRPIRGTEGEGLRLAVQSVLLGQSRFDVVADDRALARNFRILVQQAREAKRDQEQCPVDQMVPANARLVVRWSRRRKGASRLGKLWLELLPLKHGCRSALVSATVRQGLVQAAVPLAVQNLLRQLGVGSSGTASTPSPAGPASAGAGLAALPPPPSASPSSPASSGPAPPPPTAAVGYLSVIGSPKGARVDVRGPATFNRGKALATSLPLVPPQTVPAGEYTVRVSAPGHDVFEETRLIAGLGTWSVEAKLAPSTATLVVSGEPAGASATIGCGASGSQRPLNLPAGQDAFGLAKSGFAFQVPKGRCVVKASFVGWQDFSQEVVLAGGERKVLHVKMSQRARRAAGGTHGITWVRLPAGRFMMGSASGDGDEKPVHSVRVGAFEIMKTEVTVKMWRACVAAGKCKAAGTGSGYCNWKHRGREAHPINCVSWDDSQAFAAWVGGGARLCSEAEWEYAARSGGKDRKYPWGDAKATCARAVMDDGRTKGGAGAETDGCGEDRTWPVCSKAPGNSSQGVCDLAGNVWEWVQDWYHGSYSGAPTNGAAWETPAGSLRVLRGGSWYYGAGSLRAALRLWYAPDYRFYYLGLRLCR